MSVQRVLADFSMVSNCAIVVSPAQTILTYKTASSVYSYSDVQGRASECFPNDYAYLEAVQGQKVSGCCSNNSLKNSVKKDVARAMNHGYN